MSEKPPCPAPLPAPEVDDPARPIAADTTHAQRLRLVALLKANGRTCCPELATAGDVPSVTSRMSELVRDGWPIERTRGYVRDRRGALRRTTYYELIGPPPQRGLFEETPT
jgi:hypothetical protein